MFMPKSDLKYVSEQHKQPMEWPRQQRLWNGHARTIWRQLDGQGEVILQKSIKAGWNPGFWDIYIYYMLISSFKTMFEIDIWHYNSISIMESNKYAPFNQLSFETRKWKKGFFDFLAQLTYRGGGKQLQMFLSEMWCHRDDVYIFYYLCSLLLRQMKKNLPHTQGCLPHLPLVHLFNMWDSRISAAHQWKAPAGPLVIPLWLGDELF